MDGYHGNWHRSQDFKDSILDNPYDVLGIKAYQEFQSHYVEADYEDGPTFARDANGDSLIDFAVAVSWHNSPPDSIEVVAENSSDQYLPPGCEPLSRFYTYRLEDRESEQYQMLRELFFGPDAGELTTYCIDFYMRGPGLTFHGEDISPHKLIVSDNDYSNSQEEDWQLGDWPVLYMSHADDLLPEDLRDDYSYAMSCEDDEENSESLEFGSRRGSYTPEGSMREVINDLRLGGTGKMELRSVEVEPCQKEVSVQSGGDLFVIDAHSPWPLIPTGPHFCMFPARDDNGNIVGPSTGKCGFYWPPDVLTTLTATDWLAMVACFQLCEPNPPAINVDFRQVYRDTLIANGPLLCVGGYSGAIDKFVSGRISYIFNVTLLLFEDFGYKDFLWASSPRGGKFIAAWMESHCAKANETDNWEFLLACAIDCNINYKISKFKPIFGLIPRKRQYLIHY